MKQLLLASVLSVVFMFSPANVHADCRPSGNVLIETHVGCPLLHKDVNWSISWPDWFSQQKMTSGGGACATGNVCCDSTPRSIECWPEFHPPTTTPTGSWRQRVVNKASVVTITACSEQDENHNGVSEPSELHTLKDLGLKTLDLDYKQSRRTDQHGNKFRYRSKVKDIHDAQFGRWAWDVILVSAPQP